MSKVIDEFKRFACIDNDASGDLTVYVDGSFNYNGKRGKHALQFISAGWSIQGSDGTLKGYGMDTIFVEPPVWSEYSELHSILAFLDLVYEHYPRLMDKENHLKIRCDNANLMNILHNSNRNPLQSKKAYEKFGSDFTRILYYMVSMNLSFSWVKGHAKNKFNNFADQAASKGYRSYISGLEFYGPERRDYLKSILFQTHMLNVCDMNFHQLKTTVKSPTIHQLSTAHIIWLDAQIINHDKRKVVAFSYNSNVKNVRGAHFGHFMSDISVAGMELRALRYALRKYQAHHVGDMRRSVIVHMSSQAAIDMIKSFYAGKTWVFNKNCSERSKLMEYEFAQLQKSPEGWTVYPVHANSFTKSNQAILGKGNTSNKMHGVKESSRQVPNKWRKYRLLQSSTQDLIAA